MRWAVKMPCWVGWFAAVEMVDMDDIEGDGGFGGRADRSWRWALFGWQGMLCSGRKGRGWGFEKLVHCFFGSGWSGTSPVSERMSGHDKVADC
jgi:hypothetical protein